MNADLYQRLADLRTEVARKRLLLKLLKEQERQSNAQTLKEILAVFNPNCAPQLPKSESP